MRTRLSDTRWIGPVQVRRGPDRLRQDILLACMFLRGERSRRQLVNIMELMGGIMGDHQQGITSRGPRAGAEFRMGRPRTVRSTSRSSSERRLLGRLGFLLGLVMVAGVWAGQDTQDACPPARLLPMSDTGYLSPRSPRPVPRRQDRRRAGVPTFPAKLQRERLVPTDDPA